MAKFNWIPLEECDDHDGTHTFYYAQIDKDADVILSKEPDGRWQVEIYRNEVNYFFPQVICKTLTSAKRWAARYV